MRRKPVPYNTPEEDVRITAEAENDPDNPPIRDDEVLYTAEEYRKLYGGFFLGDEETASSRRLTVEAS